MAAYRILIVDDHSVVRHGLALLLSRNQDLSVCGEAGTYEEALEQAERLRPDVAIIDITLKERSGLDLVRDLRRRMPELRCLVLSMHEETEFAEKALRAGARGYVMKEEADTAIVEAIRKVMRDEIYLSERASAHVLRAQLGGEGAAATGVDSLTERERVIFRCLGQGMTTRRIAEQFGLSARTVEVHRANIKKKMGCEDAAQLLREAVRWVEANP
jgi:DNA-binding NarL/FixJ family response regulator